MRRMHPPRMRGMREDAWLARGCARICMAGRAMGAMKHAACIAITVLQHWRTESGEVGDTAA